MREAYPRRRRRGINASAEPRAEAGESLAQHRVAEERRPERRDRDERGRRRGSRPRARRRGRDRRAGAAAATPAAGSAAAALRAKASASAPRAGVPKRCRAQTRVARAFSEIASAPAAASPSAPRARPERRVQRDRREREPGTEQHRSPGVAVRVEEAHRDRLHDPARDREAEDPERGGDRRGIGRAERAALVEDPHRRLREREERRRSEHRDRERGPQRAFRELRERIAAPFLDEAGQRGQRCGPDRLTDERDRRLHQPPRVEQRRDRADPERLPEPSGRTTRRRSGATPRSSAEVR